MTSAQARELTRLLWITAVDELAIKLQPVTDVLAVLRGAVTGLDPRSIVLQRYRERP